MNVVKSFAFLAVTILAAAPARPAGAVVVSMDPKATYLHVCSDPGALNAPALSLAGLGLAPGQTILIEVLGDWDCGAPCADTGVGTCAVFSGSATLLAGTQSHRVPDAIAAGPPVTTSNTYFCNEPTDIPEDFLVEPSVTVLIPQGATHLFINARDVLYYDNSDPDGDYAVRITALELPVEPATWGAVKGLYRLK